MRFEKAAIAAPTEPYLGEPIRSGEGVVIADHDFTVIDKRKHLMDSRGPLQPSRITQSVRHPRQRHDRLVDEHGAFWCSSLLGELGQTRVLQCQRRQRPGCRECLPRRTLPGPA